MDDLASNIDFLVDTKQWKTPQKSIITSKRCGSVKGSFKTVVRYLEKNNLEEAVKKDIQEYWTKREEELSLHNIRKRKYD